MNDMDRLRKIAEELERLHCLGRALMVKYNVQQGDFGLEYSDRDPVGSILAFLVEGFERYRVQADDWKTLCYNFEDRIEELKNSRR